MKKKGKKRKCDKGEERGKENKGEEATEAKKKRKEPNGRKLHEREE